jgi:fructokinase
VAPAAQAALHAAVRAAREHGTHVSFDPNLRPHLWEDPGALRALVQAVFPHCAVVKLAEDETELCLGQADPRCAAAALVELGVGLACITLGAQGALLQRGAEVLEVPAPRVEVVDTTGAGDGFVAGLLSRLAMLEAPLQAPSAQLREAATLACAVGARVCTRLGAVAGLPRAGEPLQAGT